MEPEVVKDNDIAAHTAGILEQAVIEIYNNYPHEVKAILFAVASVLFGFGAYKEIRSVSKKL